MNLLPGSILNKRYRIHSLLGEGVYGAVYRAWDQSDQSDVAIKEYRDADVATQRLFRTEARRLLDLDHPQLPTVLDHFALEEVGQYLVMAYVDGVSLRELLAQYGLLPPDMLIPWFQDICEPLHYLHQKDQVHLGLKPANIRLDATGTLFLVDTGLPGLGFRADGTGFTAPEVQNQTAVSPLSDIYSLGATLYTVLTGQEPPDPLRRESGLLDLKPPREINPDVPPHLSIATMRALSLSPETRYESVTHFAQAVNWPHGRVPVTTNRFGTETAVQAKPPAPRLPQKRRRQMEQRTIFGLLGLLLLLIMVGVGATLFNVNEPTAVSSAEGTATVRSAVVDALTSLAPTPTPLPVPTAPPTPTPEPFITTIGSRMIYIPGGVFRMGDEEGERDEKPAHFVRMEPFFMDETEVTNEQYALCADAGACPRPAYQPGASYHEDYYGNSAYDGYPVAFVTWHNADQFCEWRGARLPSEAEWEMAAGFDLEQGLKLKYPWGEAFDGTQLNYCDARCPREYQDTAVNDNHLDTAPVGSYPNGRSPAGLYDMSGNVMEWVFDWYDVRSYESATDTNPMGPLEGTTKVLRGGSWLSEAKDSSVIARDSRDPSVARAHIGFRCAMSVP